MNKAVTTLEAVDIAAVLKYLPHRYPFLMVDRVINIKGDDYGVGIKNVTVNEPFFVGHFPDEKVMPGVLIVEAMAQAGCVYFYYSKNMQGKDLIYYLARVSAKFMKPVVPGDQLVIEVTTVKMMSKAGILKTQASVNGQPVAEAEIGFGIKEV